MNIENITKEKYIRDVFKVGMFIKGIDGILQFAGGFLLIFVNPETISHFLTRITQYELVEDSKDRVANLILHFGHITGSSEKFAAIFLLSHGLVKIFIVIGLLKNKLWAYPLGIIIFTGFGLYQMYRYYHTHALGLLVLTILDVFVIVLTLHEYRIVDREANLNQTLNNI
jgi:uncharacterized membrane protein